MDGDGPVTNCSEGASSTLRNWSHDIVLVLEAQTFHWVLEVQALHSLLGCHGEKFLLQLKDNVTQGSNSKMKTTETCNLDNQQVGTHIIRKKATQVINKMQYTHVQENTA
jgi:hypothetical protein